MANFKNEDLEYIRENARQIDDVKSLLEERDNALDGLKNQRSVSYTKNEPSFTPNNDVSIPKTHKTRGLDSQAYAEKYTEIKGNYDQKVFETTKDHFEINAPEGDAKMVEDLGKEDFTLLMEENGVEKVNNKQKEREEKEISTDKELDITMDENESKETFDELDKGQEITSLEEKEIFHDQDIELNIQMDEETSDKIFDDREFNIDDFKDNMKDMDVDKKPAPSDDFE